MVKVGSIIVVILIAFAIWYMLNGLFSKIGHKAIQHKTKFKHKAAEEFTHDKN